MTPPGQNHRREEAIAPLQRTGAQRALFIVASTAALFVTAGVLRLSAAISFYVALSFGPLLLLVLSVAGFFLGDQAVRGELFAETTDLLGPSGADIVEQVVRRSGSNEDGLLAGAIGAVLLLWSASGTFAAVSDAFAVIRRGSAGPPEQALDVGVVLQSGRKFVRDRLLSLSMIPVIALLLMASLLLSSVVSVLTASFEMLAPTRLLVISANFAISLGLFSLLSTLVYRLLAMPRLSWRASALGGSLCATLFLLGRTLVSAYVTDFASESTFGAAASLLVVLLWAWFCAATLLTGCALATVLEQVPAPAHDAQQSSSAHHSGCAGPSSCSRRRRGNSRSGARGNGSGAG